MNDRDRATVSTKRRAVAAAVGAVGVALLVAALLTTNGVLALIEAIVGLLLLAALIASYAVRRKNRTILFNRLNRPGHHHDETTRPSPRDSGG